MADQLNTKFITPEIVCSYPHLHEKSSDQSGRLSYNMSITIPKSDEKSMAKLREVMENAAVNAWGENFRNLKGVKNHVTDCDEEAEPDFPGCKKFSSKSQKRQPGCVFPNLQPVPQERIEDVFYAGAIVRASVSAYGTEIKTPDGKSGGKVIAFSLNNVMFVKDGERIGKGSSNPNDDFGDFKNESFEDDIFAGQGGDETPF